MRRGASKDNGGGNGVQPSTSAEEVLSDNERGSNSDARTTATRKSTASRFRPKLFRRRGSGGGSVAEPPTASVEASTPNNENTPLLSSSAATTTGASRVGRSKSRGSGGSSVASSVHSKKKSREIPQELVVSSGGRSSAATTATPISRSSRRPERRRASSLEPRLGKGQAVPAIAEPPAVTRRATHHWSTVQTGVKRGDFLLSTARATRNSRSTRSTMLREIRDDYRTGMNFSLSQCVTAIAIYMVISILCFRFIFEPEWSIVDCCYFAVVTFTTVGYGDLYPSSEISMFFTCLYAIAGVCCLGIAIGILGSSIVEADAKERERLQKFSKAEVLTLFDSASNPRASRHPSTKVEYRSTRHDGQDTTDIEAAASPTQRRTSLTDAAAAAAAAAAAGVAIEDEEAPKSNGFLSFLSSIFSIPLVVALFVTGSIIGYASGWDFVSTLYYIVVTSCTIGYGDLTPKGTFAEIMAIFFIPIAVATVGQWLSQIATYIIETKSADYRRHAWGQRELTEQDLDLMDDNGDGLVTRAEFLEFMLLAMDKIDAELVDELRIRFNNLDADGTGDLSRDDLVTAAKRNLKAPRRKLQLAAYKKQLLQQGSSGHARTRSRTNSDMWGSLVGSTSFWDKIPIFRSASR